MSLPLLQKVVVHLGDDGKAQILEGEGRAMEQLCDVESVLQLLNPYDLKREDMM